MSDFSLLYKKYNSVSNLTNDLNNSVIILKRRNVSADKKLTEKHPGLRVKPEELTKANKILVDVLSTLVNFYSLQDTKNELYELMDNALFKNQILNNVVYKNEIINTLEKLKVDKSLSINELKNIDKFISILDNEAAILFRKLRTSRG